jgi:hypothetical protein
MRNAVPFDAPCTYSYLLRGGQHKTTNTPVHVIPSALGGRKAPRATVCGSCNQLTNERIEKTVIDQFAVINLLLAIKPDRKPPLSRRKMKTADGERYTLAPGGFADDDRPPQVRKRVDGSLTHFEVETSSYAQAQPIVESLRRKYGDQLTVKQGAIQFGQSHDVIHDIWQLALGPEFLRMAAKIAFEYLASKIKRASILDAAFDEMRDYILTGFLRDDGLVLYSALSPSASYVLGPVDHSIIVATSEETKLACGFVTLYGKFKLTILLTQAWTGPTVGYEYVVDPLTGNKKDQKIPIALELPLDHIQKWRDTDKDQNLRYEMGNAAVSHVMETVQKRNRQMLNSYIADQAVEVLKAAQDGSLTQADMRRAYQSLAALYLRETGIAGANE